MAHALGLALGFQIGCGEPRVVGSAQAQAQVSPPASSAASTMASQAVPAPSVPRAVAAPHCSPPICREAEGPADVVRELLALEPSILGVGELHAPRGGEAISSTAARFREEFLPLLSPHAKAMAIELMVAPKNCKATTQSTEKSTKPITSSQAKTNKNDYQLLVDASRRSGLHVDGIFPTCEHLAQAARAGGGGATILHLLELTSELLGGQALAMYKKGPTTKLVLTYGGAMHNDIVPDHHCGMPCAFGAKLQQKTQGRYVELDLVVPEFVLDEAFFKERSWSRYLTSGEVVAKPRWITLGPRSFVYVFPRPRP